MKTITFATVLAGVGIVAMAAQAHARLQTAAPGPNAVVRSAPTEVRLTFNEPVVARFTTVSVTGPNGATLQLHPVALDARNRNQIIARVRGRAAPGAYRVQWTAATGDMHRMSGAYTFTLRP